MKRGLLVALIATAPMTLLRASNEAKALRDSLSLQEVVVTGTRNATDVRHLPMTVTVVGRETLTAQHQASLLPTMAQYGRSDNHRPHTGFEQYGGYVKPGYDLS